MDIIDVATEFGPVQFRGRDTGRPILLLITGAFAAEDLMDRLQERFPAVDVLRAHLPGNHTPRVMTDAVGVYAAAFGVALAGRFAGRDLVAFGLSVGALVAMGLRSPNLRGIVAVEPPLLLSEAWPLLALRQQAPPGHDAFLWNVLGIGPTETEERDYRPLLTHLRTPTLALISDPPPPPGTPFERMPGLLGPAGREALLTCPYVRVAIAPGIGHNMVKHAQLLIVAAARLALENALGPAAAELDMPPGSPLPPTDLTWPTTMPRADTAR